jgi:cytochrome c-type biogenesis protein CcmH
MKKALQSFWVWLVALAVVVVVSLLAAPTTSLNAQRISHLESIVRCPACVDISVANSQSESAIAVRHEIVARVRGGASDTMILTELENQYGVSILLSPSTSGIGSLLWLVPLVALFAGLAIAVRLVRRRT